MRRIVVSYRRADSAAMTGRIFDRLVQHYGPASVYMDIDAIPLGKDFRLHISNALAQTQVVLVVIGQKWLGSARRAGARIDDAEDPVRIEVELALQRTIPVIPLLVDGASMPKETALPESLRPLVYRNALPIDAGRDFHAHVDRLIREMDGLLRGESSEPTASSEGLLAPEPLTRAIGRAVLALGGLAAICMVGFCLVGLAALHAESAASALLATGLLGAAVWALGIFLAFAYIRGRRVIQAKFVGAVGTRTNAILALVLGAALFGLGLIGSARAAASSMNRSVVENSSFHLWAQILPPPQRDAILLAATLRLHDDYNAHKDLPTAADLAYSFELLDFMRRLDTSNTNGHILYFEGQIRHALNKTHPAWQNLEQSIYDPWYKYLEQAGPPSNEDRDDPNDSQICYERVRGYCRQRSGWIRHLMANAYYKASKQPALQANERLNRLKRAYAYVGDSVHNFPCGFTQSIGSWTLADDIRDELRTLRVLVEPIAAPSPRPAFCP